MQIDESLVRNAARRVEPHQTHGATRVHAKHPATTEGATRNPSATGTVALSSLKLRAAGRRAASSQVARFYSSDFCQRSLAPRTFARISPEANPKLAVTTTLPPNSLREQCKLWLKLKNNLSLRSLRRRGVFPAFSLRNARARPTRASKLQAPQPQAKLHRGAPDRSGAARAPGDC